MTNSVINTLNNFEQMISVKSNNSKLTESLNSGMDKMQDFRKVFDKEIGKNNLSINKDPQNTIEKTAKIKSSTIASEINSIKNDIQAETSLDLTLARDIEEIISQLKEAVEDTNELIEKETEGLIISSEMMEILSEKFSDLDLNAESKPDALKEFIGETSTVDGQNAKEAKIVEALLAYLRNIELSKDVTSENTVNIKFESLLDSAESENTTSLFLDTQELSSEQIVEFSENIADEVIASKANETNNVANEIDNYLKDEALKDLKIESISSDTNSSTSDSLMQNQTPEEYAVKAMIHDNVEAFELKIESTQNNSNVQTVQVKTTDVSANRMIEQIARQLEGLQNNSKVSIVLNPESLGKVDINLLNTKEGLIAQFTVTSQEAKDLLMKGLDGLKDTLVSHGVAVDNVSVKVSDSQKSEYNEDWTEQENSENNRREQEDSNKREKEKGLFEKMFSQVTENENGNV